MPGKSSENAKAVAEEVIQTIRKHKKVNKGKIIKKHGYSESTAKIPQLVTETKSYKEVMNPFVNDLITERKRVIKAMKKKNLKTVAYEKLSKVIDELTKNIELLSGRATERTESPLTEEQIYELLHRRPAKTLPSR